eukprot:7390178-Prymnesium_polylepis.2
MGAHGRTVRRRHDVPSDVEVASDLEVASDVEVCDDEVMTKRETRFPEHTGHVALSCAPGPPGRLRIRQTTAYTLGCRVGGMGVAPDAGRRLNVLDVLGTCECVDDIAILIGLSLTRLSHIGELTCRL